MHPALRKGPLFYKKNTPPIFHFFYKTPPIFTFFTKTHPQFRFLPTGLADLFNTATDIQQNSSNAVGRPVSDCLFYGAT